MQIIETLIIAMISAGSGLVGVVVGTVLPWFREKWGDKQKARYLAIRVVCILDEFLEQCTNVVGDDGLCCGQRNADGYLEAQVSPPKSLPLPDDVDWKSIEHHLMYRILALPSRIEAENRAISFLAEQSFPPDFEEYFEERQYRYACLGLDAANLALTLRHTYGIPDQEFGDWDPVQRLRDEKADEERRRKNRESRPSIFDQIPDAAPATQDEPKNL